MYCPRCGHQPTTNELRFCSYCGFKLGVVKASLADDDAFSTADSFAIQVIPKELRQRDINIGLILMFAGAVFAALLAGRDFGREGGALILFVVFSALVLLSRPIIKLIYKLLSWEMPDDSVSYNQRGMLFGSILMFVSTIFLAVSSLLWLGRMRTSEFFVGLLVSFVLLLAISKYLMRALRYLVTGDTSFSGKDLTPAPDSVATAAPGPALTGGQSVPVSLFTSQRVNTSEIISPSSITEHTTNLLENK